MFLLSQIDTFKIMAEMQVNQIPGGVIYCIVENQKVIWKLASDAFDLESLDVGKTINSNGGIAKAIQQKKSVIEKIPRSVYGRRVVSTSIPTANENGEVNGAISIIYPKLHPIASAFNNFAPILVNMFAEGAFIYMTDLGKIAYRQHSKLFDMPSIQIGYLLNEDDIATKTIKTKQSQIVEIDASKYGVPLYITNVPLYDEDDKDEVVATLGIVLPKKVATQLRDISDDLSDGLTGISAAIQQMAASASNILTNEEQLNTRIKEIFGLSEEINEISSFIKEIADATKMLGLNAAIEAARAGEAGRGFGVVAGEIRKLSDQSKSTVPKIKKLTDDIKAKVEEASAKSQESMFSTQEQAAATEEITASIEEITTMSTELNKIALKV